MTKPGRLRVLVVCDWFPPSTRSGGPARSLATIVGSESIDHEIRVITRDRDLGETSPYDTVTHKAWTRSGGASILRIPPRATSVLRHLRLSSPEAQLLYLNSVFSPFFSLLPMILQFLRVIPRKPILLAPRGELASAALDIKARKKRPAVALVRYLAGRMAVVWHASSEREAQDIRAIMGTSASKILVRNDPPPAPGIRSDPRTDTLTVAFVARMVPIKNFEQLAMAAMDFDGPLNLVVVGQIEDRNYWERCLSKLASASSDLHLTVMGHVQHSTVHSVLSSADALVLPTRSENFGHAIAEAMAVGCPVMVPDTTMWTPLIQDGAGWLIDVDDSRRLASVLRELAATPAEARRQRREKVREVYGQWWERQSLARESLFAAAMRHLE